MESPIKSIVYVEPDNESKELLQVERWLNDIWYRIKNKNFKEYTDIVSRLTSYTGWRKSKEIQDKFADEIHSMFKVKVSPYKTKYKIDKDIMMVQLDDGKNVVMYRYNNDRYTVEKNDRYYINPKLGKDALIIWRYSEVIDILRNHYKVENEKNIVKIVLIYWNQRSFSGSNWSPSLSYPNLKSYRKNGWFVAECYCGLMNNQNLVHGEQVTDIMFMLDGKKLSKLVNEPKIVGTFPKDLVNNFPKNDKVLLLVNPVYSEAEITRAFIAVNRVFKEHPKQEILVMMTLPIWDDLYFSDDFQALMTHIKIIDLEKHMEDKIFNEKKVKLIKLKYYTLKLVRK